MINWLMEERRRKKERTKAVTQQLMGIQF